MKDFVVSLLFSAILYAVSDALLPEGSMKKYASSIIAMVLLGILLMPFSDMDIENLVPSLSVDFEQEARELIREEAEKQAEDKIRNIEGIDAKVSISPDGEIYDVTLSREGNDTVKFITEELGVSRYDIKIE